MQVDELRARLRSFEAPVQVKVFSSFKIPCLMLQGFVERNVSINVVL